MNLVNLESVVKGYGHRVLLNGVSAGVASGESIGLVGRNGAGKSTLLALLAGTEKPDSGRVTRARDLRVGHLPQTDRLSGTVAQRVLGDRPEHEWAGDPRIRSVIAALLPDIDFHADTERLSGGETRRVALASLLAGEHDLLLLDEPTNHLDVEAIDWLAGFLREQGIAMVVVTHDRWFLDAATSRTWELAGGRLSAFDGGYAAYVLARAERARIADAAQRRRRNLLRKELAWLQRGPPARTSKPRFRIEAANALIADEPAARDGVELNISSQPQLLQQEPDRPRTLTLLQIPPHVRDRFPRSHRWIELVPILSQKPKPYGLPPRDVPFHRQTGTWHSVGRWVIRARRFARARMTLRTAQILSRLRTCKRFSSQQPEQCSFPAPVRTHDPNPVTRPKLPVHVRQQYP